MTSPHRGSGWGRRAAAPAPSDRKRVGEGKRVDFGGRRIIKKKKRKTCSGNRNEKAFIPNYRKLHRVDSFQQYLLISDLFLCRLIILSLSLMNSTYHRTKSTD